MTDTQTTPDVTTAFHEAGHAVAVYMQGGRITYVSALPDPARWGGICAWENADPDELCECYPLRQVVATYAGPTAEASVSARAMHGVLERTDRLDPPEPPPIGARDECDLDRLQDRHDMRGGTPTDEQCAQTVIAELAADADEAAVLTYWLKLRTWKLVESAKFQSLLSHLAGLLLKRGSIDGPTAMLELQRAEVRYDAAHELANLTAETGWEPA